MRWCTVRDGIETNPDGETSDRGRGHFWLTCATAWTNYSKGGRRHLAMTELDLSKTPNLTTLRCGANQLTELYKPQDDVSSCAAHGPRTVEDGAAPVALRCRIARAL